MGEGRPCFVVDGGCGWSVGAKWHGAMCGAVDEGWSGELHECGWRVTLGQSLAEERAVAGVWMRSGPIGAQRVGRGKDGRRLVRKLGPGSGAFLPERFGWQLAAWLLFRCSGFCVRFPELAFRRGALCAWGARE